MPAAVAMPLVVTMLVILFEDAASPPLCGRRLRPHLVPPVEIQLTLIHNVLLGMDQVGKSTFFRINCILAPTSRGAAAPAAERLPTQPRSGFPQYLEATGDFSPLPQKTKSHFCKENCLPDSK